MQSIQLEITNKSGLHARPAALFVQEANKFKSKIMVKKGEKEVNAKSILGVLTLGVTKGSLVTVTADGEDEQEALQAITALHESGYDEGE
ncbi:MAG TPA: HPr family phosphocarrier protein [Anaerolineaceae bacterium]|nr:HPr family phosphocarrier protein [Anaerolineaceae bacterium]HPT23935.1 HPr family phosphocarrier protein [Anaerolineaceae bacterium]